MGKNGLQLIKRVCAGLAAVLVLCVCCFTVETPADAIAWVPEPDVFTPGSWQCTLRFSDTAAYNFVLPQGFAKSIANSKVNERNYSGRIVALWDVGYSEPDRSAVYRVYPYSTSSGFLAAAFDSRCQWILKPGEELRFGLSCLDSSADVGLIVDYVYVKCKTGTYWTAQDMASKSYTIRDHAELDSPFEDAFFCPADAQGVYIVTGIHVDCEFDVPETAAYFSVSAFTLSEVETNAANALSVLKYTHTCETPTLPDTSFTEPVDFTSWLSSALSSFFKFQIFPGISLGGLLSICIGIGVLFLILSLK